MKSKKKGCFLNIIKDISGGKNDYIIEVGSEFDVFRIAVEYSNLITVKNEIERIIERAKKNEREYDEQRFITN